MKCIIRPFYFGLRCPATSLAKSLATETSEARGLSRTAGVSTVATGEGNNGNGTLESSGLIRAVRRGMSLATGNRLVVGGRLGSNGFCVGFSGTSTANGDVDSGSRDGDSLFGHGDGHS